MIEDDDVFVVDDDDEDDDHGDDDFVDECPQWLQATAWRAADPGSWGWWLWAGRIENSKGI